MGIALVAAACGQDVSSGPDEVGVAFSDDDEVGRGRSVEVGLIEPGEPSREIDKKYTVAHVPLSDRFYTQAKDPNDRDEGAVPQLYCRDRNGKQMAFELKTEFAFNKATIPEWTDKHLVRNALGGEYFNEAGDKSITLEKFDMGFDVRNIITPWIQWLHEKFGFELQAVFESTVCPRFDWANVLYNHALGANEWGLLPGQERTVDSCTPVLDQNGVPQINSDGTPAQTCVKVTSFDGPIDPSVTDEDKRPSRQVMEEMASKEFTTALNLNLGVAEGNRHFFCGPGHNQNTPDNCSDLRVRIISVEVDPKLIEERDKVFNAQEALEIKKRQETIDAANAAIDDAARVRTEAQDIAQAQSDARIAAAEAAARTENNADQLAELDAVLAGKDSIKECLALGITNGPDCALLMAVLKGQGLPPYYGSNGDIVANPAPK